MNLSSTPDPRKPSVIIALAAQKHHDHPYGYRYNTHDQIRQTSQPIAH